MQRDRNGQYPLARVEEGNETTSKEMTKEATKLREIQNS